MEPLNQKVAAQNPDPLFQKPAHSLAKRNVLTGKLSTNSLTPWNSVLTSIKRTNTKWLFPSQTALTIAGAISALSVGSYLVSQSIEIKKSPIVSPTIIDPVGSDWKTTVANFAIFISIVVGVSVFSRFRFTKDNYPIGSKDTIIRSNKEKSEIPISETFTFEEIKEQRKIQNKASLAQKRRTKNLYFHIKTVKPLFFKINFLPSLKKELNLLLRSESMEDMNKLDEVCDALDILYVWIKLQKKVGNTVPKKFNSLADLLAISKDFHEWFSINIDTKPRLLRKLIYSGLLDTLPLEDEIRAKFHIIYKSELVDHLKNAEDFLFSENHDNVDVKRENAHLIRQLITKNSMLFPEGYPSLVPNTGIEIFHICLAHGLYLLINNSDLSFFGWDIEETYESSLTTSEAQKRIKEYEILVEKTFKKNDFKNAFMLIRKTLGLRTFIKSLLCAEFPSRTSAMINTLRGIKKIRTVNNSTGKNFFIAGCGHFEELNFYDQNGKLSDKPLLSEFELSSLYEELKNRKAVVLKSKYLDKNLTESEIPYKQAERFSPYSSQQLFIDLQKIKESDEIPEFLIDESIIPILESMTLETLQQPIENSPSTSSSSSESSRSSSTSSSYENSEGTSESDEEKRFQFDEEESSELINDNLKVL